MMTDEALSYLRSRGWAVAVHNDYRMAGKSHTFWLLTNNGLEVHGEAETDQAALAAVIRRVDQLGQFDSLGDPYERWLAWFHRLHEYQKLAPMSRDETGHGTSSLAGDIRALEDELAKSKRKVVMLEGRLLSLDNGREPA